MFLEGTMDSIIIITIIIIIKYKAVGFYTQNI